MHALRAFLVFLVVTILPAANAAAESSRTLPVFDFDSVESARAAWTPATGVAPVHLYEQGTGTDQQGVRFPCNFTSVATRCFWDIDISEDFTNDTVISLRIYIDDPVPISSLTLYFRSGAGWYSSTFGSLQRGWQELRAARANFSFSGTPTGWHAIDGIRFSPWKAQDNDTEIIATELRLYNPQVLVVRGTKSTVQETATSTANLVSSLLDVWGIEYGVVTEENVEDGVLEEAGLAIFPYSNNMSATEIARIEDFVESGGKLIVFFTAPTEVFDLLGLQNLGSAGIAPRAMRFNPGVVECVPPHIPQASWNFFRVNPIAPDVQILAEWEDANGVSLEWPAWTIGNNGAYMSHILLNDSFEQKRVLMLALAVHFVPDIADQAIADALRGIGRIGEYVEFEEAVAGIRASALQSPRTALVEEELTAAISSRADVLDNPTSGTLCERIEQITAARGHLAEAYYLAQTPQWPEFRAAWASYSNTSGPFVEGWEKMAIDLSQNGFNAVMPYMATGGVAHYDSRHLPRSDVFDLYGDHIAACIAASKPRGIETHVRKLNWFLLGTPQSFIDDMRAQQRTQVDVNGEPIDWLCPSHPLNFELEMNVMLEIVDNYDIDGIHYDYIRYPGESACYCEGCRERFQHDTGNIVEDWPAECHNGALKEPYREWRREQITRLVRAMREAIDERDTDTKISAAVFHNYPATRTSIGQDWVSWAENGYLDFVCPMNYTNSASRFQAMLEPQLNYVAGRIPVYTGIGSSSSSSGVTADQAIVQLRIARQLGTRGYVFFVYNDYLADEILPNLRKGFTADPPKSAFFLH